MSEKSSTEDLSHIPMADDEVESDEKQNPSTPGSTPRSNIGNDSLSLSPPMSLVDHDLSQEEQEEKARLIAQGRSLVSYQSMLLSNLLLPSFKTKFSDQF